VADHLTIYRLGREDVSASHQLVLADKIFGIKDNFTVSETNDARVLRNKNHQVVELALASGGVWAAAETELWNPAIRPDLPKDQDAMAKAAEFALRQSLLPTLDAPFRFDRPVIGGTHFALKRDGKRENRRLDVQVVYPVSVGDIPLIGGGGDFTLTLGHQGKVIGFSGGWRPSGGSFEAKVVDRRTADEQFRAMTGSMRIASFDASLAYFAAPSFREQNFLYPVYVYRAVVLFGDQRVPLRQIMLPATEFGPPVRFGDPQPRRKRDARPAFSGKERDKEQRRSLATRSAWRPWEAGTSWIGQSGGLSGSQANAQGFVDEWAAAGWHIDFNWGDANAWESDWRRDDDTWVDNVDFAFYTGHASMNGWVLSNPDDNFLSFTEVGTGPETSGDLWGQSDLEWAIIAACGPLQDALLAEKGGDVLDRWDGAFDGMHILMGYGSVTNDNTDEGRKVSQYAKGGSTLINAWFRAAKEIQPSTNGWPAPDGPNVYVGAMWVGRDQIDPVNDHAWDFGSVSADPTSPSWLAAMWTLC
jgi:Family of unknown function (DUF6345)